MSIGFELEFNKLPVHIQKMDNKLRKIGKTKKYKFQASTKTGVVKDLFFKHKNYYQQMLFKWRPSIKKGRSRIKLPTIEITLDTCQHKAGKVQTEIPEIIGMNNGVKYPCVELVLNPVNPYEDTEIDEINDRAKKLVNVIMEDIRTKKKTYPNQWVKILKKEYKKDKFEVGKDINGKSLGDVYVGMEERSSDMKIQSTLGISMHRLHVFLANLLFEQSIFEADNDNITELLGNIMVYVLDKNEFIQNKKITLPDNDISPVMGMKLFCELYYECVVALAGHFGVWTTVKKNIFPFLTKSELYNIHRLCLNYKEKKEAKKIYDETKKKLDKKVSGKIYYRNKKKYDFLDVIFSAGLLGNAKAKRLNSGIIDGWSRIKPELVGKILDDPTSESGEWYYVDKVRNSNKGRIKIKKKKSMFGPKPKSEYWDRKIKTDEKRLWKVSRKSKNIIRQGSGIGEIGAVVELRYCQGAGAVFWSKDSEGCYKKFVKLIGRINDINETFSFPGAFKSYVKVLDYATDHEKRYWDERFFKGTFQMNQIKYFVLDSIDANTQKEKYHEEDFSKGNQNLEIALDFDLNGDYSFQIKDKKKKKKYKGKYQLACIDYKEDADEKIITSKYILFKAFKKKGHNFIDILRSKKYLFAQKEWDRYYTKEDYIDIDVKKPDEIRFILYAKNLKSIKGYIEFKNQQPSKSEKKPKAIVKKPIVSKLPSKSDKKPSVKKPPRPKVGHAIHGKFILNSDVKDYDFWRIEFNSSKQTYTAKGFKKQTYKNKKRTFCICHQKGFYKFTNEVVELNNNWFKHWDWDTRRYGDWYTEDDFIITLNRRALKKA